MLNFLLTALPIFLLRILDISLYTLRIMTMTRARKALVWLFAFFQSLVFVNTLRLVLTDLSDWARIFGYVSGFATGLVVGIWIEGRLALGYSHYRIISFGRGTELVEVLRRQGYAVTELSALGKDGMVSQLNCYIHRKENNNLEALIISMDPDAFITVENVRPIQQGFWSR